MVHKDRRGVDVVGIEGASGNNLLNLVNETIENDVFIGEKEREKEREREYNS